MKSTIAILVSLLLFCQIARSQNQSSWYSVSDNSQVLHPQARIIGHDKNNGSIFLVRAKVGNSIIPGKMALSKRGALVLHGTIEIKRNEFEIFIGDTNWVRAKNGVIPDGSIIAGRDESGNPLFAIRANYRGGVYTGKISESYKGGYITYEGQPILIQEYDVLVGNAKKEKGKSRLLRMKFSHHIGKLQVAKKVNKKLSIHNAGNDQLIIKNIEHSRHIKIDNYSFGILPGNSFNLNYQFVADRPGYYSEFMFFDGNQTSSHNLVLIEAYVGTENMIAIKYNNTKEKEKEKFTKVEIGDSCVVKLLLENLSRDTIKNISFKCGNNFKVKADASTINPRSKMLVDLVFKPIETGEIHAELKLLSSQLEIGKKFEMKGSCKFTNDLKFRHSRGSLFLPTSDDDKIIINRSKLEGDSTSFVIKDNNGKIIYDEIIKKKEGFLFVPIQKLKSGRYEVDMNSYPIKNSHLQKTFYK